VAITNLTPEVWSAIMKKYLDKKLVYGALANRDYQGEITQYGDTVHINNVGDVTISDYTKDTDTTASEVLSGTDTTLLINQAKKYDFTVDDVDGAQNKLDAANVAMGRAAYGLADALDQYVVSLNTGVAASNIVGLGDDTTPVVPTKSTIYGYFVTAGELLNAANVPMADRYVVVPPWVYSLLLNSSEFISASNLGDDVKQSGAIGAVAGFNVYISNNVPNTTSTKYKIMFGHPWAITLAEQLMKPEIKRHYLRLGDQYRGLHLYGAKLVHDDAIAVATFNKS
jgi:hypothetical protein